ncbi:MAG: S8 family serine peptidase [Acidobacteriota bacterium]
MSERARTVSLQSGTIDIDSTERDLPVALKALPGDGSQDYVLVKFPGPVTAAQLSALEARTERIYTYLPHDTFLVRLALEKQHRIDEPELGASWVGTYHPAYKIAPAIDGVAALAKRGDLEADRKPWIVMLRVFPDADLDATLARIEQLMPGKVVGAEPGKRFSRVRLLLEADELASVREPLARLAEVFWIGVEPRRVLLNDTSVWVGQSGLSGGQQTPIFDAGIYGEGQIVGVLDTGIDPDMCYFRDGTLGLPPQNPCNGGTVVDLNQRKVIAVDFLWGNECAGGIGSNEWDTQDHGTHVAGTVAGDDLANPLTHDPGDGMAPGAKLVVQDCGFQTDNCADCPGIGNCPIVDLNPVFQQAYDQGARIHTNSWGDDENNPVQGLYSAGSEDADEFMWNHPDFLLVFAAGNSGPGSTTVGSPSTGKNVVSVGATLRGTSANSMASFSSCGPTDDGRIKPDITMPGSGIISANSDNNTNSNNCNTKSSSGTSMAAPGAAGNLALIRQYFIDGWYPSGAANAADSFVPSGALLKATLVNSGRNMTNTSAIPGGCQGWGRVLLDDTLHFAGEGRGLFLEDDATGFGAGSSNETRTFDLTVSSSSEPLKVTLAWTDFPSTPAASPHINNDLDLEVSGPSGTFRGNVFSGGTSTSGGSADRLNSLEQVLIASPTPGTYTVTVRSFTVPNGPQPFALVATADFSAPCDPACDDGLFCNGVETCVAGSCQPGTSPCLGAQTCDEAADQCVGDPGCFLDNDFESGAGGWTNGASSCTTGTFVSGTPDATDWQLGSGAGGSSGALFTQPNPGGIGTDDVDGGTCETLSPSFDASSASEVTVSLDYFHGQRDAGDDAGDGFSIEVLNNGSVVDTLVAIGDVTSSPAWTNLSTTVANPGTLQLRVRASDAPNGGDIVEAGIDNVLVCPSGPPPACSVDADCDNGLFCDGSETCNTGTGACEAGTPPSCGDGISCTVDSCNESTDSCDNAPQDSLCDNGLFCDGSETCSATLGCEAGTPPSCGDGISCTVDSCNESTDACDNAPDDSACDNGLFCDGSETCSASLGCQVGSAPCSGSQTCNETTDICEGTGGCLHDVDFESGAGGWSQGADTCSTGAFIVGTPDSTAWQVGSGNPGQAFFTANNPNGIGGDDVDGGTCEALSPSVNASGESAVSVSLDYYHGQRDAGDDAGDGFTIEVLNNGTVVDTLVSVGDVTSTAAWSNVSTTVNNPGNVQLRVRASDAAGGGDIVEGGIDNVQICPTTPPPPCSVEEDFSAGIGSWTTSGSCSTGTFVTAVPTQQTSTVVTQVGGDHTSGSGNALFTATNSSAGNADVDGGVCVVESPVFSVSQASDLSVWYFHGQRDAGDDATGDFFLLEVSTDGGSSYTPLVSLGDVQNVAAWTEATTSVGAGSNVRLRVQVSDGAGAGDIVEGGIDDLAICPSN